MEPRPEQGEPDFEREIEYTRRPETPDLTEPLVSAPQDPNAQTPNNETAQENTMIREPEVEAPVGENEMERRRSNGSLASTATSLRTSATLSERSQNSQVSLPVQPPHAGSVYGFLPFAYDSSDPLFSVPPLDAPIKRKRFNPFR